MAGTHLGKYDTTAGSNSATASNSVSVAEGMLPSNINNALRDIMADVRQWYNTAEWIEYGDGAGTYTPAYASSTSFTIAGANVTSVYHVGRRVKVVASTPGTIYGSITAVSFSTNTTVTVAWDSGSLSDESITSVHIGAISASNTSLPETTAITGDYTLDVSGDIILDADGGDVFFKDAGTTFGSATNTSGNLIIKSGTTTALTFSGANATIAGDLTVSGDDITMGTNTSGAALIADGTNFNPVVISGDISIGTTGTAAIGSGVVVNADIHSSAAIDATKIHDGSISNTEFGYLNGVTSAIQTQLDGISAGTVSTINDSNFTIQDNADTSKKAQFQASGISGSTTRTFTFPDENGTILTNVVNDTTPQLGGNLDTNSANILIDDAHFIADDSGNEQIIFQKTTDAVNELEVTNGATGNGPILGASGETNVDLNLKPKGSGETVIGSGGANATLTTSGAHDLILDTNKGSNSGTITITDAANGAITVAPNGTGVVDIQGSMNPSLSSTGKAMVLGF